MQKSNHYPAWYGCFPDRGRLTCHWLSSHTTLESFLADHGESSSWQWHANQAADALCGRRALEAFSQQHVAWVARADKLCLEVNRFLAARVKTILTADPPPPAMRVLQKKDRSGGRHHSPSISQRHRSLDQQRMGERTKSNAWRTWKLLQQGVTSLSGPVRTLIIPPFSACCVPCMFNRSPLWMCLLGTNCRSVGIGPCLGLITGQNLPTIRCITLVLCGPARYVMPVLELLQRSVPRSSLILAKACPAGG